MFVINSAELGDDFRVLIGYIAELPRVVFEMVEVLTLDESPITLGDTGAKVGHRLTYEAGAAVELGDVVISWSFSLGVIEEPS